MEIQLRRLKKLTKKNDSVTVLPVIGVYSRHKEYFKVIFLVVSVIGSFSKLVVIGLYAYLNQFGPSAAQSFEFIVPFSCSTMNKEYQI